MANNVNIKFKDSQNWTNDAGEIINWSAYHQTFKAERVEASYLASEVFTDTWNGAGHDVQHIIFDVWRLEFTGRESEIQDLARMKSCDNVIIDDITNGLTHTVNMQVSENLVFADPEREADTTNYKFVLTYRIKKTIINKFTPLATQVVIIANNTYNSKYEKVNYDAPLEEVKVPWSDGEVVLEETNKKGFKVLFYFSDSEKEAFKNDYKTQDITIDGTTVVEIADLEINSLGEDNYQVIATFITVITVTDKTSGLANVVVLTSSVNTYNSKYPSLQYLDQKEEITVFWDDDHDRVLARADKTVIRVLLYLSEAEFITFVSDYNTELLTVDAAPSTVVNHLDYEATQLVSGMYQVIANLVETLSYTNATTALSDLATLQELGTSTFYNSKFFKLPLTIPSEKIEIAWPDGSSRLLRETAKAGSKLYLYQNPSSLSVFNDLWHSETWKIDGTTVIEKLPLEVTKLASTFNGIVVSGITSAGVTTYDLTPLNTHTLVATDSGTYTFYTDYAIQANVPDAEKEAFDNEDGLPVDAKIISNQVTDIKLFLNTADKNSLKLHYEKGTAATIDAVPILYRGIVETNELGYDLWEVNITSLTTSPVITYPL